MGGESTCCSSRTRKLAEVLILTRSNNRKIYKYNLKSDATQLREVDRESQETVLRRFISVVKDHASVKFKHETFVGNDFDKNIFQ